MKERPRESAAVDPSIALTEEGNVRIRWHGQEWVMPPDLCIMLQSRMPVADRFRRVARAGFMKTTEVVYVPVEWGDR